MSEADNPLEGVHIDDFARSFEVALSPHYLWVMVLQARVTYQVISVVDDDPSVRSARSIS